MAKPTSALKGFTTQRTKIEDTDWKDVVTDATDWSL